MGKKHRPVFVNGRDAESITFLAIYSRHAFVLYASFGIFNPFALQPGTDTHTHRPSPHRWISMYTFTLIELNGARARVKTQNQQNSSGRPPSTARPVQPSEMYRMGSNIKHTHARKTYGGTLLIQIRHLAE